MNGYPYQPGGMHMSGFGGYGPAYGHSLNFGSMAPPPPGMMAAGMMGAGMGSPGLHQQRAAQQQAGQGFAAAGSNFMFNTAPAIAGAGIMIGGMAAPMIQGAFQGGGLRNAMIRRGAGVLDLMDPFTIPMRMGMAGGRAGYGLAGRMGMGALGRLGMGAMGAGTLAAGPAALAMGATMAASAAFKQMHTGAMDGIHGQTFANQVMPSAIPGVSTDQQGQATGQMMRSMSEQLGVGMGDISRFGKQLNSQRVFQTVRSAKEFRSKFKEVMGAVKEIATMTQGTLDDAMGMFNNMRQQGFYSTADIKAQAAKNKAREMTTGISQETYGAIGMAGAQTARSYGMRGRYGAEMAGRTVAGVAGAVRSGAISEEMVMEHGGVEAVGMRMAQQQMGFMRTPRGRAMIAAAMGEGGAPDSERMRQILGGGMTLQGLVTSAAGRGRGTLSQAGSRESREAMLPYAGAGMIRMAMMQQQQIHGNVSRRGIIQHLGTMGLGRDEAEMMMAQVAQMPEQMRQEASASQRAATTAAYEQERYRQSISGRLSSSRAAVGMSESLRGFGRGTSAAFSGISRGISRTLGGGHIGEYTFDSRNAGFVGRGLALSDRDLQGVAASSGGVFGGVDVARSMSDEYGADASLSATQMGELIQQKMRAGEIKGYSGGDFREAQKRFLEQEGYTQTQEGIGRGTRFYKTSDLERTDAMRDRARRAASDNPLSDEQINRGLANLTGFDIGKATTRRRRHAMAQSLSGSQDYGAFQGARAVAKDYFGGTLGGAALDALGSSGVRQAQERATEASAMSIFLEASGGDKRLLATEEGRETLRNQILQSSDPGMQELQAQMSPRASGARGARNLVAAKENFSDALDSFVQTGLNNRFFSKTGANVVSLKDVIKKTSKNQSLFADVIRLKAESMENPEKSLEFRRKYEELVQETGGEDGNATKILDEMIRNMNSDPDLAKTLATEVQKGGYAAGAASMQERAYYDQLIAPKLDDVRSFIGSKQFTKLSDDQKKRVEAYRDTIANSGEGIDFEGRRKGAAAIFEDILSDGKIDKSERELAGSLSTGGMGALGDLQKLTQGKLREHEVDEVFNTEGDMSREDVQALQKELQGKSMEEILGIMEERGVGLDRGGGETTSVGGITVSSPAEANLVMVQLVDRLVQDLKAKGILQDGASGTGEPLKVQIVRST